MRDMQPLNSQEQCRDYGYVVRTVIDPQLRAHKETQVRIGIEVVDEVKDVGHGLYDEHSDGSIEYERGLLFLANTTIFLGGFVLFGLIACQLFTLVRLGTGLVLG